MREHSTDEIKTIIDIEFRIKKLLKKKRIPDRTKTKLSPETLAKFDQIKKRLKIKSLWDWINE